MAQIAPCISQVCLCGLQCFALCYKNINCIYSCGMCVFCRTFLSCFLQSLERVFSMRFYPCYGRWQICMLCVLFALLSLVHFLCVLAALFSWRSICDCGQCVLARNKTFSVDTHRPVWFGRLQTVHTKLMRFLRQRSLPSNTQTGCLYIHFDSELNRTNKFQVHVNWNGGSSSHHNGGWKHSIGENYIRFLMKHVRINKY